ncbi:hypothetical protein BFP97_11170 [Roseivirga sp. 4D4]|uniref:TlpA family protein disulfide reductase n=1 Tax=Roseivirga sp. 4D4 TaxID=1889784 RepID=UPI000852BE81|nr:TlpA disulfide reductase family protein [Roseivirga sp. 4D4]OEK02047.1 hypothetical protein BFP97_11170 [Roseivirga sp. 4D4]
MKYLIGITLILSCFASLAQEKTLVTIRQEGFGNKHGLKLIFGNQLTESNDKGDILFSKEMEITEPTYGMILNKQNRYSGFWLEPGKGEVIIKKKGFPQNTIVKGSKSHQVYQSLKFAEDNDAFIKAFMSHKDNSIAIGVLNSTFKFQDFAKEELQSMYDAVSPDKQEGLSYVRAHLNTFGLDKVKVGAQVLDFEGTDQNGNTFKTQDYRGKYLLLDFASTGCGPCWTGYPGMIEETKKYENLQVLTYNEDEEIEAWNQIAARRDIELPWPVLWKGNDKLEVFERYNVEGWPLHFLISPEGKVIDSWYGSGSKQITKTLEKHLK